MFGLFPPNSRRDPFQIGLSSRLHDQMPNFGGTGEGNFVDIHVVRDRRAGRRAKTRKNVDHAFRETGFQN